MDIKIVDQEGQEIPQEEKKLDATPTPSIPDGVLLVEQIGQLFDFKPSEVSQYKTKIRTLIDYAKLKTDDHSPEGLKWALRNLQLKVGTPPIGEKMINYLTRYAYLYLETKKLEKEREMFLKGENDD
jgi:hypothetical protein